MAELAGLDMAWDRQVVPSILEASGLSLSPQKVDSPGSERLATPGRGVGSAAPAPPERLEAPSSPSERSPSRSALEAFPTTPTQRVQTATVRTPVQAKPKTPSPVKVTRGRARGRRDAVKARNSSSASQAIALQPVSSAEIRPEVLQAQKEAAEWRSQVEAARTEAERLRCELLEARTLKSEEQREHARSESWSSSKPCVRRRMSSKAAGWRCNS
eukprot:g18890.t1